MKADDLISIREHSGVKALEKELSKGKSGFSSVCYGSDGKTVHFGTKKIDTALQDYISRYSELLETIKYLLIDMYGDLFDKRDSFNKFIKQKNSIVSHHFDFDYLTDFNKYLWNEQKHQSDISVTPLTYDSGGIHPPTIRAKGRFDEEDLKAFIDESLDNMLLLFQFIHNSVI